MQRKSAALNAPGSGPKEPCRQEDPQRHFVAVEDDHKFAQEHDLADDGTEADQHQRRLCGNGQASRFKACN